MKPHTAPTLEIKKTYLRKVCHDLLAIAGRSNPQDADVLITHADQLNPDGLYERD